jgi:hypothetical protein
MCCGKAATKLRKRHSPLEGKLSSELVEFQRCRLLQPVSADIYFRSSTSNRFDQGYDENEIPHLRKPVSQSKKSERSVR